MVGVFFSEGEGGDNNKPKCSLQKKEQRQWPPRAPGS